MTRAYILLFTYVLFFSFVLPSESFSYPKTQPINFNHVKLRLKQYEKFNINPGPFQSIHLKEAWKIFKKNKKITVAIIDTGVDIKHPFLQENILNLKSSLGSPHSIESNLKNSPYEDPTDTHGHGTHISGIIKSIFPEIQIISLKCFSPNSKGKTKLGAIIKAFKFAIDNKVDIINYSGGGKRPHERELRILQKASQKNILVVTAAGNYSLNLDLKKNNYFPASYNLKNIISVGANDNISTILPYSNYGKKTVHIYAPGHRIKGPLPNNRYAFMTGTSQSTAFVTGVAALIKSQFPYLTPLQIKEILIHSSKGNKNFSKKSFSGKNLNAYKALSLAKQLDKKRKKKNSLRTKIARSLSKAI